MLLDSPLCQFFSSGMWRQVGGEAGGEERRGSPTEERGIYMVWERSLEGWDAGTSRPVFSLYTRLLSKVSTWGPVVRANFAEHDVSSRSVRPHNFTQLAQTLKCLLHKSRMAAPL